MYFPNEIKLCDFHTHLHQYIKADGCRQSSALFTSLTQINENRILTVSCSMDIKTYEETKALKENLNSDFIIPTFGIHPACAAMPFDKSLALKYMDESPIIGEIGMDFCWAKDVPKKNQEEVFRFFLDYCNKTGKYCVIHTKGAEEEILNILKEYKNAKPIIHWYHGPEKYFNEIIKRGYYCTFGCELKYSWYIRKLLKKFPLDRLLAETDNPESDVWLGGNRKDPMLIEEVIKEIAETKNMSFDEINKIIIENSVKILLQK